MTNQELFLVDYGMGNIFNTQKALEHCGASVKLVSRPEDLKNAPRVILPGVGAFGLGMENLRQRSLDQGLIEYANSGRPLLGICLGMQMLVERSFEFGDHKGLGLVPGTVELITSKDINGNNLRVPHVGWNELIPGKIPWSQSLFSDLPEKESFVYFVHSFAVKTNDPFISSYCQYGDQQIVAGIQKGNIFGCQFHPERSSKVGFAIIKKFLKL